MESQLYSGVVFALYQLSVLTGILLLPVALLMRRLGLSVPMHRVVRRLEEAHESARPA
ncbi:hypothetical protein [Halomicrobium urmianum]|uniref:hypothetical protein n=1 Tax=Halomicrobium urmianum TaxID=1586233 RepID=UPI001CD9CD7E|nr:hypothetical protein [Halomicrobium urmianum]